MKEHKIVKVKVGLESLGKGDFTNTEKVMDEMSKEGWEVVCVSNMPQAFTTFVLITFSREIN